MSKKDYQAIARAIYTATQEEAGSTEAVLGIEHVRNNISDYLASDNPRFDRERFIEACETGKCKGMRKAS